jgi:hypothetical protein
MNRHPGVHVLVLAGLAAALGMAANAEARQAGADRPAVEVGVRMAAQANDRVPGVGGGAQLSWNVDPRTAIEASVDFMPHTNSAYTNGRVWIGYIQLKRTLHASGPNRFFATIGGGGGYEHVTYTYPIYTPGGFISGGRATFRNGIGAFTIGAGYDRTLGRHVAFDVQTQFVIAGSYGGVRTTLGLSVPVGGFARRTDTSEPTLATFSNVDVGQTAWITMADGRLWKGRVATISTTTLELTHAKTTTPLLLADVRKIEAPDRITDGALRGTLIGMAAGIPAFIAALSWDDDPGFALMVGFGWTGLGAGMGAVVGAIADSFHEGRRTVYDAGKASVTLSPIVTKKGAGVGATIRW